MTVAPDLHHAERASTRQLNTLDLYRPKLRNWALYDWGISGVQSGIRGVTIVPLGINYECRNGI